MDLALQNKTAIVTGASRGVGRAIALALGAEGVTVIVHYHVRKEAALDVVRTIVSSGGQALALACDLGDATDCQRFMDACYEAVGSVDILINNAGIWPQGWAKDLSLADWNETMQINLTSVFLTSQAFVQQALAHNQPGVILNMTSQAAFHGSTTGHAHYAASKAGVVSFTVSLAREMAPHGIRVNALALGIVETDMTEAALKERRDYYEKRIPLGRVATPEEIANIATFLVSNRAGYMTGTTVDATGGMLMR
ncbi:short-chain dehydrogenase/reductase SDR [Fictibacillus macauensis ZFHKF-1]|uniref:Short-chain dehydrogenase/reductase SDR n=1 Tax=Fictibacillus macauensis ZFHKF-1 TaxID=1196324 RepID=I8UBH9_9BACL|nr:glucose 1-dehydrogenase [Fictibacillus macauensis]EIT84295.1 short-chain dehydrogenase/reductase SDR [Fictibacillus macauensis ZFHKF-1]